MISFLRGKLATSSPALITVDVGGIGYAVAVPLSSYSRLPPPGGEVRLLIHHHFSGQDGSQTLYGFLTEQERDVFKLLLSVSGIGPKIALNVLNGISAAAFQSVLASGDAATLAKIRGVGKKTSERILVELRDKVGAIAEAPGGARAVTAEAQAVNDAILALVSLGYKQADAQKAATKAREALGANANVEELVRRALQGG